MLKNKLYLYGNDAEATVPAHLHLGKYMLNKFKTFGDHEAILKLVKRKMLKNKLYLYGNDAEATVPAHLHLGKYMLNKFKTFGDHEAIINAATDERMTFKELTQLTVDIALSLVHIGVNNGDVVSICSENVMEFLPVIYGTLAAGATFSAIDASCGGLSSSHRFNIARPKILFCSPSTYNKNKDIITSTTFIETIIIFGDSIEEAIGFKEFLTQHANVDDFDTAPVNPLEDTALIVFSSGTTGMPKGIRMTHYNYLMALHNWYSEIYTGMRSLPVVDWYLNYGQYISLIMHQMGLALVYYNNADTKKVLEIVQDYKINVLASSPTAVNLLLKQDTTCDISSLRVIFVAGAPCDGTMLEAIKEKLTNPNLVYQFYGMTETGTIASPRRAPGKPPMRSVGTVRDLFVVKIVDLDSRKPVGANQRGEICFKSASLTKGYIGGPVDCFDEDGFFKTGDIGYYDDDKYLYVVDRIKDVIKYNCFMVNPAEMEAVLLHHPAVLEVGVVGAPHQTLGELPTAFVVLKPGATATEQELVDYVNEQMSVRTPLAGGVRFIDKIPRSSGVKVDRKKLKQILQQN